VTYSGNTATGCTEYGVIIDQSYPDTLGNPDAGVKISVSVIALIIAFLLIFDDVGNYLYGYEHHRCCLFGKG
jgi:hypothetical protein